MGANCKDQRYRCQGRRSDGTRNSHGVGPSCGPEISSYPVLSAGYQANHYLLVLSSFSPFSADKQKCWSGWLPHGKSCLKYFDQQLTWTAAQAFCENIDGSLAKLDSEEKSYFVFLWLLRPIYHIESSAWIGLSRDSMNNFYWPDGTRADYTNWGLGNPDNRNGKENSTEMDTYSGLWNDVEFDHKNPFVCQKGKTLTFKSFWIEPPT